MKDNGCQNIWCKGNRDEFPYNCFFYGSKISQCDIRKKYKALQMRISKRLRRFDRNDIMRIYDEEMLFISKGVVFDKKWRKRNAAHNNSGTENFAQHTQSAPNE